MKFILSALLLFSLSANATDFYVDSAAVGTNSGTLANPWNSIASINQASINAGDFLLFNAGESYSGSLTWTRSGTIGNPITIGKYGSGAKPKLIGTGSTISSLFYLFNRSYVIIRDVEITDPSISPTDRSVLSKIQRGIQFDGTTNNSKVINVTFSLVGVGVFLVGNDNTVDSCTFTNLRMIVSDNDGGVDDYGANPLVISSSRNIVTHNYINGAWAESFDFGYDGGAFEFFGNCEDNFIAYNTAIDCNGFIEVGSNDGALNADNIIAYNLCINNNGMTYLQLSDVFATTVDSLQFYNNVFIETAAPRGVSSGMVSRSFAGTPAVGTVIMRNNVFQLSTGIDVARASRWNDSTLIHTNNVYKLSSGSITNFTLNVSEVSTAGTLFKNTTGDPSIWDYTLADGSPAINVGMVIGSLTQDFAGTTLTGTREAGILQYAASTSRDYILCPCKFQ